MNKEVRKGPIAQLVCAGHAAINAVRACNGELVPFGTISERREKMYEQTVCSIIGNRSITDAAIHEEWCKMARGDDELKNHHNLVDFGELEPRQQLKVTAFRRAVLDMIPRVL